MQHSSVRSPKLLAISCESATNLHINYSHQKLQRAAASRHGSHGAGSLRHRDKLQDVYLASKLHEATPRQVPQHTERERKAQRERAHWGEGERGGRGVQ